MKLDLNELFLSWVSKRYLRLNRKYRPRVCGWQSRRIYWISQIILLFIKVDKVQGKRHKHVQSCWRRNLTEALRMQRNQYLGQKVQKHQRILLLCLPHAFSSCFHTYNAIHKSTLPVYFKIMFINSDQSNGLH